MKNDFTLLISTKGLGYKEVGLPSVKSGFQEILFEHLQPLKELVAFREFPGGR
jgi:hypothetical protein